MQNDEKSMILDRYEPIETAGVGGFAKVIHAYDTRLKREVAIKIVDLSNSGVSNLKQASVLGDVIPGLAEARAAGKLANANIVTIYDCEVSDSKAYVIEEYVEGITLTTLLRRFPDAVNLHVVAHIFKSVATAVMAAHKENILHLDIKPDNILIGRGGEVKVADFGLATLMDLNGEGAAQAGTLGYMPLEQMRRENLDVRTDEWSLAMVTYEMLTGINPFSGAASVTQAQQLMMNAELVVPSACWDTLDDAADDAIFKALNVNRDARFASVRQFMSALRTHLGDSAEGKKQLAVLVNGNDEKLVDTSTIATPAQENTPAPEPVEAEAPEPVRFVETETPVIDNMGWKGWDFILKTLGAIAAAIIVAFAAANLTFPLDETACFMETQPAITGILALASAALVWVVPRYGVLLPFAAIETMCNLSSAWGLMAIYAITFLLWWSFLGRQSDRHTTCFLFAALAGAFGFAPVAIALTGALARRFSHAAIGAAAIFFQALIFASFGSCNLFSWDIANNFIVAVDSTNTITNVVGNNFLAVFSDPCTWIVGVIWLVSACMFALFCSRKASAFHVLGALLAGVVLIMSAFVQWPIPQTVDELNLMNALAALVADGIGIALAASGFTATARKDPWAF